MSMKLPKRPRFNTKLLLVTGLLLGAMVAQPFQGMVNALQQTDYTLAPFTDSELANWTTDRSAPSGGFSSIDGYNGRDDVLELRVDGEGANLSGTQFYATEGLKKDISADSIKADLYVDTAWAGHSVRAGLWGVGVDSAGNVSSYPIVEYTTVGDDGFVGWRAWDSTTGVWANTISATPGWNTVEILHDKDAGLYEYNVNGTLISSHDDEGSVALGSVILNNRNYGSSDYAVRWSDFAYGSETFVSETPLNLRLADINGDPMLCGDATNQNYITPTWNAVEDAVSYNYSVTLPSGATYGPVNVGNVTSVSGAFGAEGVSSFSVQAVYADGQTSDWSVSCAVTYDITSPSSVDDLSDLVSGTVAIKQIISDNFKADSGKLRIWQTGGSGFYASPVVDSDTNGVVNYTLNTKTNLFGDGEYLAKFTSWDAAGNGSVQETLFTVDNSAPAISNVVYDNPAFGITTIRATITDPHGVSLSPGDTHVRYTHGVTDGVTGTSSTNAKFIHVSGDVYEATIDTKTFVPEGHTGTYWFYFRIEDNLGNAVGNDDIRGVVVDNRVPTVNAEDFGVGSWTNAVDGFTGVNVGFNIENFKHVSGVTVELHDENGVFVTNTASMALINLINSDPANWSTLSSSFVTSGTSNDTWCSGVSCWVEGIFDWSGADKPVKAVITVNGTNVGGQQVTDSVENSTFSEAGGTFASILPIIAPPSQPNNQGRGNGPSVPPVLPSAASPRAAAALRSNPSVVVVNDNGQALGASTETPAAVQTGGVLSATDENDDYDSSLYEDTEEEDSFSSSWFWLFAPVALGGTWLIIAALRRNS